MGVLAHVLIILALFLPSAYSQIKLLEPKSLVDQFTRGVIEGSTAAFGTPYYGKRITGRLVYGDSGGSLHCTPEDYHIADPVDAGALPNIVVVRRGTCNFVTKVRVAQDHKEAVAVIVVDREGSRHSPTDIKSIIMADDGWGSEVEIPSILVSDAEGSLLIDELRNNKSEVIVELAWDIPQDDTVSMDFWITPAVEKSVAFLKEYAPYARLLQHKLDFRPHYWIFPLPRDYKDLCLDESAKFCAFDPDMGGTTTGKDVVEETLRQVCLWKQTVSRLPDDTRSGKYSQVWWDYVVQFPEECKTDGVEASVRFGKECSERVMRALGVDLHTLRTCVETEGDSILSTERENHAWSPLALRVNDWRYSGPLDPEIVTRAVCSAFEEEHMPHTCADLLSLKKSLVGADLLEYQRRSDRSVTTWIVTSALVAAVIVVVALFICYRCWIVKHLRKSLRYEVMAEVKQQMTSIDAEAGTNPNPPAAVLDKL